MLAHLLIAALAFHHHYPHITPLPPPSMDGGTSGGGGGYGIAFALVGAALFFRYLAKRNGE